MIWDTWPRRAAPLALALAFAGLALALPLRDAAACTTSSYDIDFYAAPVAAQELPTDGVIAIAVLYDPSQIADVMAVMTIALESGGVAVEAEAILHDLAGPPSPGVEANHPALLVIRPLAPLAADTDYTLSLGSSDPYTANFSFWVDLHTAAGPRQPPQLVADAVLTTGDPEVLTRLCCETAHSSCGESYYCTATELRERPAVALSASVSAGDQLQALPWVSPLDAEGAATGRRYPSSELWWIYRETDDYEGMWSRSAGTFHVDPGSGKRCFAAGITDLVSGEDILGEPFCVDTDDEGSLPSDELVTREPSELSFPFECIGPWIDEREGAIDQDAEGCSIGGDGGQDPRSLALLALVVAASRRRRER